MKERKLAEVEKEREVEEDTHVFGDQKRRPDSHKRRQERKAIPHATKMVHGEEVPIVHDHDAHYYHNRRAGHHDLEEVHHRHDLFDFEDPQSDSDYDDMDEETGIYHDEDPEFHPAQYVRH